MNDCDVTYLCLNYKVLFIKVTRLRRFKIVLEDISLSNMTVVFYFLLNLFHFFINLYCFIEQFCVKICLYMRHSVCSSKGFQNYMLENLGDNLPSKLPKHIAILIGLEAISIVDVTKLIDWCKTAQIPHVSFYDHKGLLQKNCCFIREKLESPSIKSDADDLNKIDTSTNTSTRQVDKMNIQFLSYLDGKSKIVSLTKQLSILLDRNDNYEKDITSQLISENLNCHVKTPEPDLAIVFGKTMCSYGFLPWHTRITEFFVVPTHCGLSYDEFTRILIKYSKCQQRYGK